LEAAFAVTPDLSETRFIAAAIAIALAARVVDVPPRASAPAVVSPSNVEVSSVDSAAPTATPLIIKELPIN